MPIKRTMGPVNPRIIYKDDNNDVIKSTERAMEILEFFADYRKEATRVEVVEALEYPESSTAALLRSLEKLANSIRTTRHRHYVRSLNVLIKKLMSACASISTPIPCHPLLQTCVLLFSARNLMHTSPEI